MQRSLMLCNPDPSKDCILDTDASDSVVGAVLSQAQPDGTGVVAYYSKALQGSEIDYCST